MSKSRLFEGELPHIFIVMVALQNILSYSPRSNSVEGQMSKSLDCQIGGRGLIMVKHHLPPRLHHFLITKDVAVGLSIHIIAI